jgi:hypothetical protein
LKLLSRLLENRIDLEDVQILDTVIESFAELYDAKQARLDSLRAILVDGSVTAEVRQKTAAALGKLHDLESLRALAAIATNTKKEAGILNLQTEAVRSLGKLGVYLKSNAKPTEEVIEVLRSLLDKYKPDQESPKDLLTATISAFGELADPEQAGILFPYLSNRAFNTAAVQALHAILLSAPQDCPRLVENYLQWRVSAPPIPAAARIRPDEILVGLNGFYGPETSPQAKERAIQAITQALAVEAHLHPEEAVRKLAAQLLDQLVTAKEVPRVDPGASEQARKAQLEEWKKWWRENSARPR